MGDRYFMATAMAGRLYVEGLVGRGWDRSRLTFQNEAAVDLIVQARMIDRKVRSLGELCLVLEESQALWVPAIAVWIREDLVDLVQELSRES